MNGLNEEVGGQTCIWTCFPSDHAPIFISYCAVQVVWNNYIHYLLIALFYTTIELVPEINQSVRGEVVLLYYECDVWGGEVVLLYYECDVWGGEVVLLYYECDLWGGEVVLLY